MFRLGSLDSVYPGNGLHHFAKIFIIGNTPSLGFQSR